MGVTGGAPGNMYCFKNFEKSASDEKLTVLLDIYGCTLLSFLVEVRLCWHRGINDSFCLEACPAVALTALRRWRQLRDRVRKYLLDHS